LAAGTLDAAVALLRTTALRTTEWAHAACERSERIEAPSENHQKEKEEEAWKEKELARQSKREGRGCLSGLVFVT
jgi:hypothetical protein